MSNVHWLESPVLVSTIDDSDSDTWSVLEIRSIGCLLGGAIGDAFASQLQPNDTFEKMSRNPIHEFSTKSPAGAPWSDSTSISLALSASLIIRGRFEPYDQLARYKRWWRHGYLAANGRARLAFI